MELNQIFNCSWERCKLLSAGGWAYQSFHQYLSFPKYQISNETKYQSFNQYLNFPKYQDKRMLQMILNWTDGNINQSINIWLFVLTSINPPLWKNPVKIVASRHTINYSCFEEIFANNFEPNTAALFHMTKISQITFTLRLRSNKHFNVVVCTILTPRIRYSSSSCIF